MIAYITELNSGNFETFKQNKLSLVDVWAPWCGPCKLISPIIDQVSVDYQGQLSVGELNADDNTELIKELGVRNIPTLLFYKDGQQLIDANGNPVKLVGNISKSKLEELINQYL